MSEQRGLTATFRLPQTNSLTFDMNSRCKFRALLFFVRVAVGLLGFLWCLTSRTYAQGGPSVIPPPANDNFANATELQEINGSVTVTGSTEGATREPGEPYNTNGVSSVWYKWAPSSTARIQSVVEVGKPHPWLFQGSSSSNLVTVARENDSPFVYAGATYYIAAYAHVTNGGVFRFTLRPTTRRPDNDDFANATELQAANNTVAVLGTCFESTYETNELSSKIGTGSVWYKWAPEVSVRFTQAIKQGSGSLSVFQGASIAGLTLVEKPEVSAGQTYFISVTGNRTNEASFHFILQLSPFGNTTVANDAFADAIIITGATNFLQGDFRAATAEPGEPDLGPSNTGLLARRTLWWKYVATEPGYLLSYGGMYAIHKGASLTQLERVGFAEVAPGLLTQLSAGEACYFQVQAPEFGGVFPGVNLRFSSRLSNDDFQNAIRLPSSSNVDIVAHNASATVEAGELMAGSNAAGHSVWYSWMSPFEGTVQFSAGAGNSAILMAVYRGSALANLQPVPSRLSPPFSTFASGPIPIQPGELYYIQIDSSANNTDVFRLVVSRQSATAPNDSFSQAISLNGNNDLRGSAVLKYASLEAGEPEHMSGPHKSVWWRWEANTSGYVTINATTAANTNITVGVYAGDQIENLQLLTKGEQYATLRVRGGQKYNIAIAAPSDVDGNVFLGGFFNSEPENPPFPGNVVQNPSFEEGERGLQRWTTSGNSSFSQNISSPDGTNSLLMPKSPGGISQIIATDPGITYSLRLAFIVSGSGNTSRLRVVWNQTELGIVESRNVFDWVWTNFSVQASMDLSTLVIENLADPTRLDAVTLVPLPQGAPRIVSDLSPLRVLAGDSATFIVNAQGAKPLWYKWYHNGKLLPNSSQPILTQEQVTQPMAGTYHVVVANAFGSVTSADVTLRVIDIATPVILVQPASGSLLSGTYSALSVLAAGTTPLTYQWHREGVALSGATNSDLIFSAVDLTNSGSYTVTVASPAGTVASQPALLTVKPVTSDPANSLFIDFTYFKLVYNLDDITPLSGPQFFSQLSFGSSPDDLHPLGDPVPFDSSFSAGLPSGRKFPANILVPFVPRLGTAFVQMRVWERAKGATFAHARAAGGRFAQSAVTAVNPAQPGKDNWTTVHIPSFHLEVGSPAYMLPDTTPAGQTITFAAIPDIEFGAGPIQLNAQASSELPVSFSIDFGPASVSGNLLTITGAGIVGVKAIQPGNESHLPAPEILRTFHVRRGSQVILFDPLDSSRETIELKAASSAGLPVGFEIIYGTATIVQNALTDPGEGPITLRAFQAGNENYDAAPSVLRTIIVHTVPQTIDFAPIPDIQLESASIRMNSLGRGAPLAIPPVSGRGPVQLSAIASSGLPVAFILVSGPGTLTGNTLTPTGEGQITVRASQPGDVVFRAVAADQSFNVRRPPSTKAEQTIHFEGVPNLKFGTGPISLNAQASSGLRVDFEIISGRADLSNNTVIPLGAGVVTVRATQPGDSNYQAALPVERMLAIAKGDQRISFDPLPSVRLGSEAVPLNANASSGLPVSFEIVSGPAAVSGNSLAALGAGMVRVRAYQNGNADYESAPPVEQILAIGKKLQTISFAPPADVVFGSGPIELIVTASSGLPVEVELISGTATLSGKVITPVAAGALKIRATQPGNEEYEPAMAVEQSLAIKKRTQTIQFEPLADAVFASTPVPLFATASSGLPVSFEVVSGKGTISGNLLTLSGAGQVIVRARQSGDERFENASDVERTLAVGKASQSINFSPVAPLRFGDPPLPLKATSDSGLPVKFEVLSGPVSLENGFLMIKGAGLGLLSITQPGDDDYLPAPLLQNMFTIQKGLQTILFEAPATIRANGPPVALIATATSQLPVTFRIVSGPGVINDGLLIPSEVGTVAIEAAQVGDLNFEPAPSQQRSIDIIGLPRLSFRLSNSAIILIWPARDAADFKLESAASFEGPWQEINVPSPAPPQDISLTIELLGEKRFFRLRGGP